MGKDKYMDGFKYDVPAEKLGYIQKLGADRMAPGKKADLTAMKMMHGDAAAKYYDGAGMYMNGAPKYEGASKSMHSPMKHIDGTSKGHAGEDRPSYEEKKTSQVVVPGTSSSTDTSSSGGGTSSTSNYDKLMSSKKDLGPDFKPTKEQTAKANEEVRIAKEKDKAAKASSSSTKKSTKPSVKTEVKKDLKVSKNKGASELLNEGKERESNRRKRYSAGQSERVNLAKKDSANVAQKSLIGKPLTEKNLMKAVQKGNQAGRRTLVNRESNDANSFKEKMGEFKFTHSQAADMFSADIGKGRGTVTSGKGSKAKEGESIPVTGGGFSSRGGNLTPSQIGSSRSFGKKGKGEYTLESVNTDAGSQGSYGGYKTPQEYLEGGTPKMPKGPLKYGMKK